LRNIIVKLPSSLHQLPELVLNRCHSLSQRDLKIRIGATKILLLLEDSQLVLHSGNF
jgi:hypothetical protein